MQDNVDSGRFHNDELRFQEGAFSMPDPAEMFGDLNVQDFMLGPVDLHLGISGFDATGID